MVEQAYTLDLVFSSLGDRTRRDILHRVSKRERSIGEIAAHYGMSFAGVAKHVGVLERAGLVRKTRRGKQQVVSLSPQGLLAASSYLESYTREWEGRLDSLDTYLRSIKNKSK